MLRFSFLSHLQFVTLGYFNTPLKLLLSTRLVYTDSNILGYNIQIKHRIKKYL
jgi:hypothetical protein